MDSIAPIDSRQSAPVSRARKLLRPSGRKATGQFLVEGPQSVREAVRAGSIDELFFTDSASERHPELVAQATELGARMYLVTDAVLEYLSDTVNPQGLSAVVPTFSATIPEILAKKPQLIVVLDQVQDPGNAGTVIRIADAAGADAVLATANTVDVFNPKCVRASAGSIFHIPVVSEVVSGNLQSDLRSGGIQSVAAIADATHTIFDAQAIELMKAPTCWFFGNEANGLSPDVVAACDHQLSIPMFGQAESLNLAAAAAVCIYASVQAQLGS